jgi:opacity protein-like surface antigen
MRAIIVALFLVGAFVACTFISEANPAAADSPPKQRQWQYQCFEASGVAQVTERSNKMGQQGWELVTSAGTKGSTLWCFKRPLWKPTK